MTYKFSKLQYFTSRSTIIWVKSSASVTLQESRLWLEPKLQGGRRWDETKTRQSRAVLPLEKAISLRLLLFSIQYRHSVSLYTSFLLKALLFNLPFFVFFLDSFWSASHSGCHRELCRILLLRKLPQSPSLYPPSSAAHKRRRNVDVWGWTKRQKGVLYRMKFVEIWISEKRFIMSVCNSGCLARYFLVQKNTKINLSDSCNVMTKEIQRNDKRNST